MAHFFRANEIANVAIEIEKKGREFYMLAAQKAKSSEIKDIFTYLADEETKHEQVFRSMLDRLGDVEMPAWASHEEYMQYLEALIESHMLFGELGRKFMERADSEMDVLKMAMSFEKDTMLFFMEMMELVPASEKYVVQQCYEEERKHLRDLSKMSAKMKT